MYQEYLFSYEICVQAGASRFLNIEMTFGSIVE